MLIEIHTNNQISIDGKDTGLAVLQKAGGTVVYTRETYNRFTNPSGARYKEHVMPSSRYSLVHDNPSTGVAGRAEFECDLLTLMGSEGFSL